MFTSDAQDGLSDDTDVAECAMLLRRLCVTTPWANLPDNVWRLVLRDLTLDEAVAADGEYVEATRAWSAGGAVYGRIEKGIAKIGAKQGIMAGDVKAVRADVEAQRG